MIKIIEQLSTLKEMADGLPKIEDHLRNSEEQRIQNLLQIFIWRNTTTLNHWCDELYTVCHNVARTKTKNKYPKEKFILQNIWLCWEDCYYDRLKNYIDDVEYKETKNNKENKDVKIPNFSKNNFYNFMKDYHIWLAHNLSMNGMVTRINIKEKIKELLNKYSIN